MMACLHQSKPKVFRIRLRVAAALCQLLQHMQPSFAILLLTRPPWTAQVAGGEQQHLLVWRDALLVCGCAGTRKLHNRDKLGPGV
jgi:hypothetical protein